MGGAYLIDTKNGLILIDTGIPESLYLLVHSIYQLGYNMTQVKKILITHAHFDHMGAAMALKKLSNARLYMSKEDAVFLRECPQETYIPESGSHVQYIDSIDEYYTEDRPISLGEVSVRTLLTPGHTPGCTSFFGRKKIRLTEKNIPSVYMERSVQIP